MLGLGNPSDQNGHAHPVLREDSGHRFTQKDPGLIGYLQTSGDRVIVGECEKIHLSPSKLLQEFFRIGNACRHFETPEQPLRRSAAVSGVKVKIGAGHEVSDYLVQDGSHEQGRATFRKW